jgi:5-methylcytosine-specific restriction endonuclease McrA
MLRAAVAIHHIEPRSTAPNRVYDLENVIPLCHRCHEWADAAGEDGRSELKKRVRKQLDRKVKKL